MRGSRLSEARRHPPGNADADAWNGVAGTEVEGGVGGQGRALSHELGVPTENQCRRPIQGRALSHELGVPTENQCRRVSYPETQHTRVTRRQFLACIPAAAALKGCVTSTPRCENT